MVERTIPKELEPIDMRVPLSKALPLLLFRLEDIAERMGRLSTLTCELQSFTDGTAKLVFLAHQSQ